MMITDEMALSVQTALASVSWDNTVTGKTRLKEALQRGLAPFWDDEADPLEELRREFVHAFFAHSDRIPSTVKRWQDCQTRMKAALDMAKPKQTLRDAVREFIDPPRQLLDLPLAPHVLIPRADYERFRNAAIAVLVGRENAP